MSYPCLLFFYVKFQIFLKKSKWNIINQQTIPSAQSMQKRIANNYKRVSTVKIVVSQSSDKEKGYDTNHESDNEKQ